MFAAAAVLAALLLLLVLVLPPQLAAARWPARAPVWALLLWQALALAVVLALLELPATLALAPVGPTHAEAVRRLAAGPHRHLPPAWAGLVAACGLAVLARLVWVLVAATVRTVRARARNRTLVDLVATRNPLLRGTHVVDHALPVAYCLPGLRPRLVVSRGVLALLSYDEVQAVLAHEQAHLAQRHDLVVLPFLALQAGFGPRRPVRLAREQVDLLVELLADDSAARAHDRGHLARALWKIGNGSAPAGALGVDGGDTLLRARRLLTAPAPLPAAGTAAVLAAAVAVVASPALGLVVPLLLR